MLQIGKNMQNHSSRQITLLLCRSKHTSFSPHGYDRIAALPTITMPRHSATTRQLYTPYLRRFMSWKDRTDYAGRSRKSLLLAISRSYWYHITLRDNIMSPYKLLLILGYLWLQIAASHVVVYCCCWQLACQPTWKVCCWVYSSSSSSSVYLGLGLRLRLDRLGAKLPLSRFLPSFTGV